METYRLRWEFTFWPFKVDPYVQTISWSRFDNFNKVGVVNYPGFHLYFTGSRNIQIGVFNTRVLENMKTIEYSVVDTVLNGEEFDPKTAFDYDLYFQEDYLDPWWKYEVGTQLLNLGGNYWYGTRNYYYYWF